jgi:SAM-dependent methyltransferase
MRPQNGESVKTKQSGSVRWKNVCIITSAIKHIKCHAGLDPASSPILDSRLRGNDGFDIYCIVAGVISSGSGKMSEQLQIEKVFKDVHEHQRIAELIQKFSTNKGNVQKIALEGLDLSDCRQILDLGCAFGSFSEKLKGRVAADAMAAGVDIIAANKPLYLAACARASIRGRFFSTGSPVLKTFQERSFDLALCSYALYFFPEVIPEVARLLRPEGIFAVITHCRRNNGELIDLTKRTLETNGLLQEKDLPLEIINNRFSSDNGEALLKPWFGRVVTVDFTNTLVFTKEDTGYLLEYFRFKSPLYLTDAGLDAEAVLPLILENLERASGERNGMTISKDDRIFICSLPRHGGVEP